jgi:hypothetical protein
MLLVDALPTLVFGYGIPSKARLFVFTRSSLGTERR